MMRNPDTVKRTPRLFKLVVVTAESKSNSSTGVPMYLYPRWDSSSCKIRLISVEIKDLAPALASFKSGGKLPLLYQRDSRGANPFSIQLMSPKSTAFSRAIWVSFWLVSMGNTGGG